MTMKESILQVHGFLSAGCAPNIEKALAKIPGVHHATANYLNSTATVHYDENKVSLPQLQMVVADCGYVCAGESAPEHLAQAGPRMPVDDHSAHTGHATAQPMDHNAHAGHALPA